MQHDGAPSPAPTAGGSAAGPADAAEPETQSCTICNGLVHDPLDDCCNSCLIACASHEAEQDEARAEAEADQARATLVYSIRYGTAH